MANPEPFPVHFQKTKYTLKNKESEKLHGNPIG